MLKNTKTNTLKTKATKQKYIFITGGVISSVGKGITAASLGAILKSRGYKIIIKKCDPYLNIDAGTMNPEQHGEVFVTNDGAETDLDFGHYERFTSYEASKNDSITIGSIYSEVISKERKGDYLGKTIQVVPHITNKIKERICQKIPKEIDFVILECGGTIGDIEGLALIESIRQLSNEYENKKSIHIHVTYLPYIKNTKIG